MRFTYINELKIFAAGLPVVDLLYRNFPDSPFSSFYPAELFVINQFFYSRIGPIQWICRVTFKVKRSRFKREGIKNKKTSTQYITNASYNFDNLKCLQTSNDTRQYTEDTTFGATWNQSGRRRRRI